MSTAGWRTVLVRTNGELRLKEDHIVLSGEQEFAVPIDQVARLVIARPSVLISSALLVELAARSIRVIICDRRCLPACEVACLVSRSMILSNSSVFKTFSFMFV